MSKPLSPQAQAVMDAFHKAADGDYINGVWTPNREVQVAAALRAAIRQVQFHQSGEHYVCDAADLIAIVEELEAGG